MSKQRRLQLVCLTMIGAVGLLSRPAKAHAETALTCGGCVDDCSEVDDVCGPGCETNGPECYLSGCGPGTLTGFTVNCSPI